MPCQRSFDPVGATGGGARAYCELESGSFRTPAGHGPAPQALQASIPGKLYDIAQKCVRYESGATSDKRAHGRCVETRALFNPAFFASDASSSFLNAACTETGPSCIEMSCQPKSQRVAGMKW